MELNEYRCRGCGEVFPRPHTHAGQIPKRCGPCQKEHYKEVRRKRNKKRMASDPAYAERKREVARDFYARNAEKVKASQRARYWRNKGDAK